MRRLLLGLLVALFMPAAASARNRVIAPPGNSGVNQYVESIPTAGGNRPTSSVHPHAVSGVPGGSGGSGSPAGGALSPSTERTLAQQGADGRTAAAVAQATAPGSTYSSSSSATGTNRSNNPGTSAGGGKQNEVSTQRVLRTVEVSPSSAVLKALTGSASSGGLGALLPIILVVSLVGFSAVGLLRRRRTA